MKREVTNNNNLLIEQMEIIVARAPREGLNAGVELGEPLLARLSSHLTVFKTIQTTTMSSEEVWRHLNRDRGKGLDNLILIVRGFWNSVEAEILLGNADIRVRQVFAIPAIRPTVRSPEIWKSQAELIVAGAARMVELGLTLETRPGTAEVAEALAQLRAIEQETADAKLATRTNQQLRRDAKQAALLLLREVSRSIDLALLGQPKELIRDVKRVFGFRFETKAGPGANENEPTESNEPANATETNGTE